MLKFCSPIVLALLLAVAACPSRNHADREIDYRTFTIREGNQWAGPFPSRVRFWWGPTTREDAAMLFVFDEPEEHVEFTIKLFGLSMARLSRTPAHHDSDRFVATYLEDGVRIRPYAYREGEVVREEPLSVFVQYGEPVSLGLSVTGEGAAYTITSADTSAGSFIPRAAEQYRSLKLKNFAHARGGRYSEAPVTVSFRAAKIRLDSFP